MARRSSISPSPQLAALTLLLLICFSRCAVAARLLPASTSPGQDIGVKAADAAPDGLVVLPTEGGKVGNGEEAVTELTMGGEERRCARRGTAERSACRRG